MRRIDPQRASEILAAIRGVRVLVVGDVMLDVYLRGGASRISPEAPVPVVRVGQEWRALGGAANVAANLATLGAASPLIGLLGDDGAGHDFRAAAADAGIDPSHLVTADDRPTTVKTRVLVGHQQVARYDRELDDDVGADTARRLAEAVEAAAHHADAIVLEDYDKGVLVPTVVETALDIARRRELPVVVDPKARHFFDFKGCTVFKPNQPELANALRAPLRPEDAEWMERTRRHLECEALLLTLGGDGMSLAAASLDRLLRIPALARSVYDVSGAGDTVTAVVAATLAAGGTVDEGAVLATHAAGIEVGKAGVVTVTPDEILDSVRVHQDDGSFDPDRGADP